MVKDRVRQVWNANAGFWDSKMGEGNYFHKTLIEPTQLKLLNIRPGDSILDIACGNGQFARKMAALGARVTAVDFSDKFIAIARSKDCRNIAYQVLDVTSKTDLKKLAGKAFDAAVCTMALMDMEHIDILIRHLPKVLKNGGKVIFSILHPCFNSGEMMLVHESDDLGGRVKNRYAVKISNYLVEKTQLGVGIQGQPAAQYYFHRPVSTVLTHFFQNGFVLDAYEEPAFTEVPRKDNLYDNVFRHIPPALICRLKLPPRGW